MSHFIPGDTPTLYAGGSNPLNDLPKPQGPQFTFFGMPLPSLNFGKFWGSGRNTDGGRTPKGNGQQLSTPAFEEGFRPLLNSGGFKPIFDPYSSNVTKFNNPLDSFNRSAIWNSTRNSLPQATITKVATPEPVAAINRTQRKPQPEPVYDKPIRRPTLDQSFNQESDSRRPLIEQIINNNQERPKPLVEQVYNRPEIEQVYSPVERWPDEEVPITASSSTPYPPLLPPITSTSNTILDNSISSADISIQEVKKEDKEEIQVNRGPASLSGFLAPGGQLPPYRPAGRPTITKVAPQMPIAEEIHGGSPRTTSTSPTPSSSPTLAWYFENYNNTNLEPYIGPGSDLMGITPLSSAGYNNYVFTFPMLISLALNLVNI